MSRKTLSRIAAVGIAVVSAVSSMAVAASADMSSTYISYGRYEYTRDEVVYRVDSIDSFGKVTGYTIYASKAAAERAQEYGKVTSINGDRVYIPIITSLNLSSVVSGTYNRFNWDGDVITATTNGIWLYTGNGTVSGSGTSTSLDDYYISYSNKYATNFVYASPVNGKYYPNAASFEADPINKGLSVKGAAKRKPTQPYSSTYCYFDYSSGTYSRSQGTSTFWVHGFNNNYNEGFFTPYSVTSSSNYAENTCYKYNEVYYPNYKAMYEQVGNVSGYTIENIAQAYRYTNSRRYFDPLDGKYYSSNEGCPQRILIAKASDNATGKYVVWYSSYTEKYYNTYDEALVVSPSANYVKSLSSDYSAAYLNSEKSGSNTQSTSTKKSNSFTVSSSKGWNSVVSYLSSARAGAYYIVNMKNVTTIPADVLSAINGKSINVDFKLSNGVVFSINGGDVTSDRNDVSVKTTYGTKNIPSNLIKKAVKANDGVSSSQISVDGRSFGASVSMTVKFSAKRSGCAAKLYRYDSSDNTLTLVSRSAVQNNGKCTFDDLKQGGDYLVVLS